MPNVSISQLISVVLMIHPTLSYTSSAATKFSSTTAIFGAGASHINL